MHIRMYLILFFGVDGYFVYYYMTIGRMYKRVKKDCLNIAQ